MKSSISELAAAFSDRPETIITITCDFGVVNESARQEIEENLREMFIETVHVEFKPIVTFSLHERIK